MFCGVEERRPKASFLQTHTYPLLEGGISLDGRYGILSGTCLNLQPAVQLICAYKASSRLLRAAQRRTKEVKAHDNQRCGSHPVERGQVLRRKGAVRELRVPCPVRSRKELQRIQTNRPLIAPAGCSQGCSPGTSPGKFGDESGNEMQN